MEMDVPLKVLFRQYASDLLHLTHDEESTVLSVDAVELQAVSRRVDCLIKLGRAGEVYYRHIEFQSGPDPDMAERCFRYNSQLLLQLRAPVVLAGGAPGLLALVPLMEGGQSLEVIARAAAGIDGALAGERNPDARSILLYLAGALYNIDVLTRLFGR